MHPSFLHQFHETRGARFLELNGREAVADFGDVPAEHRALHETAAVFDLSFRGRLCLTGADRTRFLHGQVTNDINRLQPGEGCYAALVTAKGKMQSDLNVYRLPEELLLDFEPGLTQTVSARLEKFIVADDVQVQDASPHYGLLSVQGPRTAEVIKHLGLLDALPPGPLKFCKIEDASLGEIYLLPQPRLATEGADLFVPVAGLAALAERLTGAARAVGGRLGGWTALEMARIEAGIPRFGLDMNETNLPQECGIESRALSYTKGCYIGQEVLNRLHTLGHVNRELRGLQLADDLKALPGMGDPLLHEGREVGIITSAVRSARFHKNIALGYVRRETNQVGTQLTLRTATAETSVQVIELPFKGE